jgi:hypothetical protein
METENYPIDEATQGVLNDIRKAQVDFEAQPAVQQVRQATASFEGQFRGALFLYLRQHKLEGNWRVAENGKELVKESTPIATPEPIQP